MFEDTTVDRSNLFGLAEISSSDSYLSLTEVAKNKLSCCDQLFVVMATGISGCGKSTRLTSLMRPDLKRLPREDEDLFRSSDGPNPVTGLVREGIDFPCFGPVRLSYLCEIWGIPNQPGDEQIAIIFVDSQGTKSLEDSGQHRGFGMAALTTILGLRLCVASRSRPSKLDVDDILGGLKMNLFVTEADGNVCPYAVAVMHPDVYQPYPEEWTTQDHETHEEKKRRDSENCKTRWQRQESKLRMENFKVWLMDSPLTNFQGYWNAMRELAEWIGQLARQQKRSFKMIDGFMNAVCDHLRELRQRFPDLPDDADIDTGELLKIWLSRQWIEKGEEFIVAGENAIDASIENATIDQVMKTNPQDFTREPYQEVLRQLDQLGESLMVGYRHEITNEVKKVESSVETRLHIRANDALSRREYIILNNAEKAIGDGMLSLLDTTIQKWNALIENKPLPEILTSELDDCLIEEGNRELEVAINTRLDEFCFGSSEVQNHTKIKKVAADKLHEAKLGFEAEIRKCFTFYHDKAREIQLKDERDKALKERLKQEAEHQAQLQAQEEEAKRVLIAQQEKAEREAEAARKALEEKEARLQEERRRQEEQQQYYLKMQQQQEEYLWRLQRQQEENERRIEEESRKAAAEHKRMFNEMKLQQENLERQLREEAETRDREKQEKLAKLEKQKKIRQDKAAAAEKAAAEKAAAEKAAAEKAAAEKEAEQKEADRREAMRKQQAKEEADRRETMRKQQAKEQNRNLKPGVNVRVQQGARVYGESYPFHSWVYSAVFELRQLNGDRGVIYYKGGCTGAIHVKDLILA